MLARRLLLLLGLAACSRGHGTKPSPADTLSDAGQGTPDSLLGAWYGCAARLEGPPGEAAPCELPSDRVIRFSRAAASVAFETDLGQPRVEPTPAGYVVTIPEGAHVVRAISQAKEPFWASSLKVVPSAVRPWVMEAKTLRSRGDLVGARERVVPMTTSSDAAERGAALSLLARIELAQGNTDASIVSFRKAIAQHRETHRLSDAVDDAFALSFALVERGQRYAEARTALDEQALLVLKYPEGRARAPYYRALIATDLGDVREAARLFDDARSMATALDLKKLLRNIVVAKALLLLRLGRIDEGRAALENGRAPDASPCERAEDDINLAYAFLLGAEDRLEKGESSSVGASLRRVVQDSACEDAYLKALAASNLAYEATLRGDAKAALAALAEARKRDPAPKLEELLFRLDLEARNTPPSSPNQAALALFDRERALAASSAMFDAVWRAETGRAELFAKQHDTKSALLAYAAAEAALDKSALRVPFAFGRSHYLGGRLRSVSGHVALLVQSRRYDDAYVVVRRSRSRVLRALAKESRVAGLSPETRARYEQALESYRRRRLALDAETADDWKRSQAELATVLGAREKLAQELVLSLEDALRVVGAEGAPEVTEETPDPRRLTLLAFSLVDREYIFAHRQTTRVVVFPKETAKRDVPAALAEDIGAADSVRILSSGIFHDEAVLQSLLVDKRVEYPLDLGISARTADAVGNEALVVSDPRSDLPNAKQEGEATAEALRSMGFRVLTSQGAAVSHSTLASGLPQAAFFHYAGHAVLQGVDGFSGGFPLKNGSSFNVGDILSLPQVPRIAVVFGCEGARTAGGPVETLGIAQAFVMRGSLVAVAPQRVVDDKASSRFATSFYAELAKARARQSASDGNSANSANSGNEWARLVGLAVTAAKQGHPDASAFRVVVP